MNTVDLLILVVLIASIVNGVRQGGAAQVISFGGFWGGFALGAVLAPITARFADGAFTKALVSMGTVLALATVGGQIGRLFGGKVFRELRELKLGAVDSAVGAGVAALATVTAVWLAASMLASAPVPEVSENIHESRIVRALTDALPPAPKIFSRFRGLLDSAGFPDVFAELEPDPGPVERLPGDEQFLRAANAAEASTVKIQGHGCGGISSGSGFIAAPNIVITNAHVVAGAQRIDILDRRVRRTGVAILFDPDMDIAILRTGRFGGRPLPLAPRPAAEGSGGAVLGFPGGGGLREVPAQVMNEFRAVGRDIYSERLTTRRVYQLNTQVLPGNSGGPFVVNNGEVAGVIFSASSIRDNVGYAITSQEVRPRLDQALRSQAETSTGRCAA